MDLLVPAPAGLGRPRLWLSTAILALVAFISGCAEELGQEPMETTRVTGVVTQGNVPVGTGWVEFLPYVGTVGNIRSAPLRPDGSFVADGVAVGWNRIGIAGAAINLPRGRRFFDSLSSPILRRVTRSPSDPITIDLYSECMKRFPQRAASGKGN